MVGKLAGVKGWGLGAGGGQKKRETAKPARSGGLHRFFNTVPKPLESSTSAAAPGAATFVGLVQPGLVALTHSAQLAPTTGGALLPVAIARASGGQQQLQGQLADPVSSPHLGGSAALQTPAISQELATPQNALTSQSFASSQSGPLESVTQHAAKAGRDVPAKDTPPSAPSNVKVEARHQYCQPSACASRFMIAQDPWGEYRRLYATRLVALKGAVRNEAFKRPTIVRMALG